ncbi:unnamed protein product [Protopolystoma xenopodis]|uniref:Uncharacterized protein n=1 Tax=Protopolystoma xenopodis TaxID=117903 RepID=A0A3S5CK51_9PLAT|nr:unnamed protein product [Protopolystoma xenopodis]
MFKDSVGAMGASLPPGLPPTPNVPLSQVQSVMPSRFIPGPQQAGPGRGSSLLSNHQLGGVQQPQSQQQHQQLHQHHQMGYQVPHQVGISWNQPHPMLQQQQQQHQHSSMTTEQHVGLPLSSPSTANFYQSKTGLVPSMSQSQPPSPHSYSVGLMTPGETVTSAKAPPSSVATGGFLAMSSGIHTTAQGTLPPQSYNSAPTIANSNEGAAPLATSATGLTGQMSLLGSSGKLVYFLG